MIIFVELRSLLSGCLSIESPKVLHVNQSPLSPCRASGSYPTGFFHSHRGRKFPQHPSDVKLAGSHGSGALSQTVAIMSLDIHSSDTGTDLEWLGGRYLWSHCDSSICWDEDTTPSVPHTTAEEIDDRDCVWRLVWASPSLAVSSWFLFVAASSGLNAVITLVLNITQATIQQISGSDCYLFGYRLNMMNG